MDETLAAEQGIEEVRLALATVDPPREEPPAERGLAAGFDSFDQIYLRATGDKSRERYSSLTVVGMMNSPHLEGMSAEARRNSVMMALEAAGVPVSEILQDAMLRQSALDGYSDLQEQKLKAFEVAVNESNRNTQAELERITASYKSEIRANTEQVAGEQAAFRGWQASKRRESENMMAASAIFTESGGGAAHGRFGMGMESQPRR